MSNLGKRDPPTSFNVYASKMQCSGTGDRPSSLGGFEIDEEVNQNMQNFLRAIFGNATREQDGGEEEDEVDCPGPNCGHSIYDTALLLPLPQLPTLEWLIELGNAYHCVLQTEYRNISLLTLAQMLPALVDLQQTVGLQKIKSEIVSQIMYHLQGLSEGEENMMHTVLTGDPGLGKSHLIDILARIYRDLGIVGTGNVVHVRLDQLKSDHIGGTAKATQKAINSALGGIMVIDEAYSLADGDKPDSFSRELVDTLNRNLTERAGEFICIIAGYKDQIEGRLFAMNPGLNSRFRFRYHIDQYNEDELTQILIQNLFAGEWYSPYLSDQWLGEYVARHSSQLPYAGRDITNLIFHIRLAHSDRLSSEVEERYAIKFCLTQRDMEGGWERYERHCQKKESDAGYSSMYL